MIHNAFERQFAAANRTLAEQFGAEVSITPNGGGDVVQIYGVFDQQTEYPLSGFESHKPIIHNTFAYSSDYAHTPALGDQLAVDETTYRVTNILESDASQHIVTIQQVVT